MRICDFDLNVFVRFVRGVRQQTGSHAEVGEPAHCRRCLRPLAMLGFAWYSEQHYIDETLRHLSSYELRVGCVGFCIPCIMSVSISRCRRAIPPSPVFFLCGLDLVDTSVDSLLLLLWLV